MSEDQLETIAPAALEEGMLAKANNEPVGKPEDLAAVFFQRNYPRMKNLVKNMSRRGLERSLICAAAFPLVPDGYKPQTKEEHELAWVLEQMMSCKIMMCSTSELNRLEKEQQAENLSLHKGETNGEG